MGGLSMRSRVHACAVLLLVVLALSGAAAAEQVTITLWGGVEENIRQMIPVFEARNPHIKVEYTPGVGGHESLFVQMAAGTAPDVFLADIPWVENYHRDNLALDLASVAHRLDVPLDKYPPHVLSIFSREGRVYALPKGFTPVAAYYRKDIFDGRGVAYPEENWTWNDHLELARRLTYDADGDGTPDIWGTYMHTWVPFIEAKMYSYGTDLFNPTGTQASGYINSPRTVEFFEMIMSWVSFGITPPPGAPWASITGAGNNSGPAAIGWSGHWWMHSIRDQLAAGEFEIGVTTLPRGPYTDVPATSILATGWAVWSGSEHPEEAVELVKFLGGPDYQRVEAVETLVEIPGHVDAIDEMIRTAPFGTTPHFVRAAEYGRATWTNRISGWAQAEGRFFGTAINNIWNGGFIAGELDNAARQMDAWLAGELE